MNENTNTINLLMKILILLYLLDKQAAIIRHGCRERALFDGERKGTAGKGQRNERKGQQG